MISTLITTQQFTGNGSTSTAYVLPFRVLKASHVRVEVTNDTDGTTQELTNGVDFTVTGAGADSCSFTTAEAWDNNHRITATVSMPITQDTNLVNHGRFDAEVIERRFDYLTLLVQIMASGGGFNGDRAILFPAADPKSQTQYLPVATERKDRVLYFDPETGEMEVLRMDQLAQRLLVILGAEAVLPYRVLEINADTTLSPEESNAFLRANASSGNTITIGLPETDDFDNSFSCEISRIGDAAVEFEAAPGVILESSLSGYRIFGKFTSVAVRVVGANRWQIYGDLY